MNIEAEVWDILQHPWDREWTVQGFGMMRTYLDKEHLRRLQIWDDTLRIKDVSDIHTHPWHFHSYVVVGAIGNATYEMDATGGVYGSRCWPFYMQRLITPGENVKAHGVDLLVRLSQRANVVYHPGEWYAMHASQIHRSWFDSLTITVVERDRRQRLPWLGMPDLAYSYYAGDLDWVSAEPRPATPKEVAEVVALRAATAASTYWKGHLWNA